MAKIITCNTNGIRAAARKGFFEWLQREQADVVCIQETKAQVHQLEDPVFTPEGYHCYYNDAVKKGYSGTALYSREEPIKITRALGSREVVERPRAHEMDAHLPGGRMRPAVDAGRECHGGKCKRV